MAHFFMRIVAGVRLIAATIVVVCFAYMTIAVLAQVFGRYVFNYRDDQTSFDRQS